MFILQLGIILIFVYKRKIYWLHSALKGIDNVIIRWSVLALLHKGEDDTYPTGTPHNGHQGDTLNKTPDKVVDSRQDIVPPHVVFYEDQKIIIKYLSHESVDIENQNVLRDVKQMRVLTHANVNCFIAICPDSPNACILMAYASHGRLQDIIADKESRLSYEFKVSFILDIACGMWYLHQSLVEVHGHLTSANCVVDNRWTCKVTGHGLKYIRHKYGRQCALKQPAKLLWTAPELLDAIDISSYTQKGDVYSFAIISQEVFLNDVPYAANQPYLGPDDIINRVRSGRHRPALPEDVCSPKWSSLIQDCWNQVTDQRPTFNDILYRINSIHRHKTMLLVDNMIKRLEKHTQNLEERVAQRAMELRDEKVKVDVLLRELLPGSVAEQLSAGIKVQPETFANVTIFFSDIVGFTRISALSTPLQIVAMLNSMYSLFDDIAHHYDVYKVATIGDAYMVASGVPLRNGDEHAAEVCHFALGLLDAIQDFPIPHLPNKQLQMRSGIHSGSCVAGVAGIKMPRYLLFGDTVDIAAKMESGGEAMKIHISETSERLVRKIFNIQPRGTLQMKGNQTFNTFWLEC